MEGTWQSCLKLDFIKMHDLYFEHIIPYNFRGRELDDLAKRSAEGFRQNKSFWTLITM